MPRKVNMRRGKRVPPYRDREAYSASDQEVERATKRFSGVPTREENTRSFRGGGRPKQRSTKRKARLFLKQHRKGRRG